MSARQKRVYSSELRDAQAAATRQRVLHAAADLFAERGYSATTLVAIASRAGVSTETVQSHGPKLALLRAATDLGSFGAGRDAPVLETALGLRYADAESVEDAVQISAEILTVANRGSHGVWTAFREAARSDPTIADELAELTKSVRAQHESVFAVWHERGWVRQDIPRERIVEWTDMIGSFEVYDRLVCINGRSVEDYREFVASLLRELVAAR